MNAAVLFYVHLCGGEVSWEPVNGCEITGTTTFKRLYLYRIGGVAERRRDLDFGF